MKRSIKDSRLFLPGLSIVVVGCPRLIRDRGIRRDRDFSHVLLHQALSRSDCTFRSTGMSLVSILINAKNW